jgi:hypothetical protein
MIIVTKQNYEFVPELCQNESNDTVVRQLCATDFVIDKLASELLCLPLRWLNRAINKRLFTWYRSPMGVRVFSVPEMRSCNPDTVLDLLEIHTCVPGRKSLVYFMQPIDGGPVKIGVTDDLPARMRAIQANSPVLLRALVVLAIRREAEQCLHFLFAEDRLHYEWFTPSQRLMETIAALRNLNRIAGAEEKSA